jgi:hypothetical protein
MGLLFCNKQSSGRAESHGTTHQRAGNVLALTETELGGWELGTAEPSLTPLSCDECEVYHIQVLWPWFHHLIDLLSYCLICDMGQQHSSFEAFVSKRSNTKEESGSK